MAQVDYTPNHTGAKSNTNRLVGSISVGNDTYTMPSGTRNSYTDLTTTKTFAVEAGTTVTLEMTQSAGSWMNAFVYVDMDNNGFTAGIASDNYTPTGDLVSYSFYNQGYSNDENGRNSAGNSISGNNRSTLALPSWTVPADLAPGEYRIRFKYDWCNINPAGDIDTYFSNTFTGHGGEIIDAKLVVLDKSELQALIAEAEELLSKVSEAQKTVGEELNITGKISSNAAQNPADGNASNAERDGAGIAGLTDTDPATYFHSRWGGTAVNADHYLQIDLGENGKLSDFCFEYATRKTNDENQTSPAPLAIEVRVSEDGSNFGNPIAVFTKDANGLPTHADLGATLWRSDVISATENIRYIRLTVTDSKGPGSDTWNGHHFFAMGTLNIYPASTTYSVKEGYSNVITVENVEDAIAALAAANSANNGTITLDELNNATNNLNNALQALRVVYPEHTLTVTSAGWATLYLDFPATIPTFEVDDAGAYIVTGVKDGNWLNLVKVEGVLPAATGIIVKADAGDYTFAYSTDEAADVTENLLKGTIATTAVEGEAYVLGYAEGTTEVVFGKAKMNGTSWVNNAYKAYLPATALPTGVNAAYYSFRFGEGTTGIDEITEQRAESKDIYDLTGRRVEAITAPGIYIVNGKKVLVK